MSHTITRRGFLGGVIAGLPLVRVAAARLLVKEAEFVLGGGGFAPFIFTTYSNGKMTATRKGKPLEGVTIGPSPWSVFGSNEDGELAFCCVRRLRPGVLDVNWVKFVARQTPGPASRS